MFGRLILETYVQDRCRDVRFKDEHLSIIWEPDADTSRSSELEKGRC